MTTRNTRCSLSRHGIYLALCFAWPALHGSEKSAQSPQKSPFKERLRFGRKSTLGVKRSLSHDALCPCPPETSDCFCRTTKFLPFRSIGNDVVRVFAGSVGHTHQFRVGPSYASFAISLGYDSSWKPGEILQNLFGGDIVEFCPNKTDITKACNTFDARSIIIQGLAFQGSARNPRAWLADYFYLPQNFQSVISFEPHITRLSMLFDLYIGIDAIAPGVYIRFHGPVEYARWDLNFCETLLNDDVTFLPHPPGYFTPSAIAPNLLLPSFGTYAGGTTSGCAPAIGPIPDEVVTEDELTYYNSRIIFQPLHYARISHNSRTRTGFADLTMMLGWDAYQRPRFHFGMNIQAVAPTAPKKNPDFLFDPVIGNRGHWELGGGLTMSYVMWASEDEQAHVGIAADISMRHVFKAHVQRTLELYKKPNSIYMLAAKFGINGQIPKTDSENYPKVFASETIVVDDEEELRAVDPGKQFALEYAPLANLSTINVNVSVDLKVDAAIMLNVTCRGCSFDVGYNFWTASEEKVFRPDIGEIDHLNGLALTNPVNESARWALKGDARMFGFTDDTQDAVPLSATESKADIHNGTNRVELNCDVNDVNINIDTPAPAYLEDLADVLHNCPGGFQINTSKIPILLNATLLDFVSIKGISHKVFAHAHFTQLGATINPHVGFGGYIEFGTNDNFSLLGACDTNSRIKVSLSQWGVWIKGGITFG